MSIYMKHFGLTKPPFSITPAPDFFYSGAKRGEILDALLYAALNVEGMVKVTGEVGSGKTMLCRMLLEKFPDNVDSVYLANPAIAREEILYAVAEELGLDPTEKRPHSLARILQKVLIEKYLQGRKVVVVIDEAHAMPDSTLEELRLLYNLETNRHKLLQIVLFGQPELDQKLALPKMRQLKERITHHFSLLPMPMPVVVNYLAFRMDAAGFKEKAAFSSAAARRIWMESGGLGRRINILADKALLAAYVDNAACVQVKHAKTAALDSGFRAKKPYPAYVLAALVFLALPLFARQGSQQIEAAPQPMEKIIVADLFSQRAQAFVHVVSRQNGDGATIQLAAFDEAAKAKSIIIEAAKLLDPQMLYAVQAQKKYWLFYGTYPSTSDAKKAIAALPETIRLGLHPVTRAFSDFSIANQKIAANFKKTN